MKIHIKTVWIRNLKSGKYKKGHFVLRRSNESNEEKFSCFGILCDSISIDDYTWESYGDKFYYRDKNGIYYNSELPEEIMKYIELDKDSYQKLQIMNDSDISFNEIADWIETNL